LHYLSLSIADLLSSSQSHFRRYHTVYSTMAYLRIVLISLLYLLPLASSQSVTIAITDGITTTYTLPAWTDPVVAPFLTLTTTVLADTTTTIYVPSATATSNETTTSVSLNPVASSLILSILSAETAISSSNATATPSPTVSPSTSTSTVFASMILLPRVADSHRLKPA